MKRQREISLASTDGGMAARKTHAGLRFWTLLVTALFLSALLLAVALVAWHAYSPGSVPLSIFTPLVYLMAGSGASALSLAAIYLAQEYPNHRRVLAAVILITLGILCAHLYTINSPSTPNCFDSSKQVNGCVMDEVYYVPAAETMLAGTRCAPYADHCNLEHPFLSKAFIAAGIALFGDNVFGWRFFEVLLGTASIPVLFAICWVVTKNSSLSLIASYLLAFETLFFVHSSIAVIDVHAVFFGLVGFLFYLAGTRVWKLDSFILAGIALGLSALSKETALFFVAFLLTYHLLFGLGSRASRVRSSLKMLAVVLVVFAGGLQFYDSFFGTSAVPTFVDDVRYILSYGASLTGTSGAWTDPILHTVITPLNWLTYYSPVGYLVTNVSVNVNGVPSYSYVGVGYYGITNMFEIWLTYLWVGYIIYVLWRAHRSADSEAGTKDFRLAVFALLLFVFNFFSYVLLWGYGRVTYPYYIIDAVPGIAVGCSYLLTRAWFPRIVTYILLGGVFFWFFLYYPDKNFLPVQLRAIIGR
jgi:4-amino-4-deoxy-L-arabinose transferase-like glycosyltransferase